MHCPKCESPFEEKKYGAGIQVHSCQGCGGILCKTKTLEKMRSEWMADLMLDRGDPNKGRELDKMVDINCPSCSNAMSRIFDEEQAHVFMELCESCDLIFLDAGELTDLSDFTLMEKLKNLLS